MTTTHDALIIWSQPGIIFPNDILFGDTTSHIEVKKRLLGKL